MDYRPNWAKLLERGPGSRPPCLPMSFPSGTKWAGQACGRMILTQESGQIPRGAGHEPRLWGTAPRNWLVPECCSCCWGMRCVLLPLPTRTPRKALSLPSLVHTHPHPSLGSFLQPTPPSSYHRLFRVPLPLRSRVFPVFSCPWFMCCFANVLIKLHIPRSSLV